MSAPEDQLAIFTTGGTIDKIYFDALSEFQVGDTALETILREANVGFPFAITSLMKKDSLDITDADRAEISRAVKACASPRILVTHGTDTMLQTAKALDEVGERTIVFTGAMQPASQRRSDAVFNIGFAIAVAMSSPPGVYVAMNGQVFNPLTTRKNRDAQRFETT